MTAPTLPITLAEISYIEAVATTDDLEAARVALGARLWKQAGDVSAELGHPLLCSEPWYELGPGPEGDDGTQTMRAQMIVDRGEPV